MPDLAMHSPRARRRVGVLCAAGLLCVTLRATAASDALVLETLHDSVPPFTLNAADGAASLDSAGLAGRLVLVHFWATWCTPCRQELPALQRLAGELDPARAAVVLVAIDDADTSHQALLDYAHALNLALPLYVARDSRISASFWSWGVPVSYLIDARGQFVGRMRGPRAWDDPALRAALEQLEPSPSPSP